ASTRSRAPAASISRTRSRASSGCFRGSTSSWPWRIDESLRSSLPAPADRSGDRAAQRLNVPTSPDLLSADVAAATKPGQVHLAVSGFAGFLRLCFIMRLASLLFVATLIAACGGADATSPSAGPNVTSDPAAAQIVTSDLVHFWAAYDAGGKNGSTSEFQS